MLGQSEALDHARSQLRRYAACNAPVLIEGETGTGKELAAREIHYASARHAGPFVPVNCGALPDSLIENELFGHSRGAFTDARQAQPGLIDHAHGGTLFLDEVDSLSVKGQVTLLRFLQDNEYRPVGCGTARTADVRIVAAGNACLDEQVAGGHFRRDLLYRLNALFVRLPPLRERGDDITLLAQHFLEAIAQQLGTAPKVWSETALRVLRSHAWPGNVRELESVALRACLRAEGTSVDIGPAELTAQEQGPANPSTFGRRATDTVDSNFGTAKSHVVARFEREYLTDLIRRANGNVSEAARLSGTERRQLGKMLKKHGIESKPLRVS
jgi:DNA-binding NtrC family response regulator